MGLCLYVFDRDFAEDADEEPEELGECDVGHYSDFGYFRDMIESQLDSSRFPTLMTHSDCDGEWSVAELPILQKELREIAARFQDLPPKEPKGAFEHTAEYRGGAKSLYDCFHEVNGENLFDALIDLAEVGLEHQRPITFQ